LAFFTNQETMTNTLLGLDLLLVTLPMLFYPLAMETIFQGRSLGKKAVGIRVLSLEGGEPNLGQYLLSWIFRFGNGRMVFRHGRLSAPGD
jgi:uncharacterized RDD family membrane protein YckC